MSYSNKGYTLNNIEYPKMMSYSPDGFGRDKYIHYDNGGFWKDNYHSISLTNKYDVPKFRNYHSWSDGSGRDTYVIHESGGLEKNFTPLRQFNLKKFLRTPESGIFNFVASPMKEGVSAKTLYISKQEFDTNQKIKKIEKDLLNRLYYSEKHKFSPLPLKSKVSGINSSKFTLPKIGKEINDDIKITSHTPKSNIRKDYNDHPYKK